MALEHLKFVTLFLPHFAVERQKQQLILARAVFCNRQELYKMKNAAPRCSLPDEKGEGTTNGKQGYGVYPILEYNKKHRRYLVRNTRCSFFIFYSSCILYARFYYVLKRES